MFLLTFEFLDLQLAGIFLSIAMASPLTSEMNIATFEDNGPSRSSCLKRTVTQSIVALLTAGRREDCRQGNLELHYYPQDPLINSIEYIQYDTGRGG